MCTSLICVRLKYSCACLVHTFTLAIFPSVLCMYCKYFDMYTYYGCAPYGCAYVFLPLNFTYTYTVFFLSFFLSWWYYVVCSERFQHTRTHMLHPYIYIYFRISELCSYVKTTQTILKIPSVISNRVYIVIQQWNDRKFLILLWFY